MKKIIFITWLTFFTSQSLALSPENHLKDELQEKRAMKLFLEVRCPVCQGQVIENSNAEFAFEMRKFIRQKILEGKGDTEIKAELIKEFGNDILVYSDFHKNNFLLWLLPAIFALIPLAMILKNKKNIPKPE